MEGVASAAGAHFARTSFRMCISYPTSLTPDYTQEMDVCSSPMRKHAVMSLSAISSVPSTTWGVGYRSGWWSWEYIGERRCGSVFHVCERAEEVEEAGVDARSGKISVMELCEGPGWGRERARSWSRGLRGGRRVELGVGLDPDHSTG